MIPVKWKVDGMDCASCAAAITKSLQKQGMQQIKVNHVSGDVSFETVEANGNIDQAAAAVESLGYKVSAAADATAEESAADAKPPMSKHLIRFVICLPFTLLLMAHMWVHQAWLHDPYVQLALAIPVYLIGMSYFGTSAWKNLRKGIFHMNVLIAVGATAAFLYSCIGLFMARPHEFLFFETSASIITIVFFGNWIEQMSTERTQRKIKALTRRHKVMANMIAYDDQHNELIFPIENKDLKVGDLILIRSGEEVPMDCKVLSGEVEVNEAIITGESVPVHKKQGDILLGGSVLANGNAKCYVVAVGSDTVMSSIVHMMQDAQTHKPPVQLLADRISAIFIPAVLIIAAITFLANILIGHLPFADSLMRAIAVLVISCPCAMGLATPAALAVGMGRATQHGILYTDPASMESFAGIRQMVFDKTGTLTTGRFTITAFKAIGMDDTTFQRIVHALEKMSNHPIAKSISEAWKTPDLFRMKNVEEIKGLGMKGTDKEGNTYQVLGIGPLTAAHQGSIDAALLHQVQDLYAADPAISLVVLRNDACIGWISVADELRPEAADIIRFCQQQGIRTILLSGDTEAKCQWVAERLHIDTIMAGRTPQQKMDEVERLCAVAPTVMVGDGINDAPALAKATISISLSEATQLAIQNADVVLTNGGLKKLPEAMLLGKATYATIRTNLFWAFAYNVVAIPMAALGMLSPALAAFSMGASDLVLALNSLWLGVKRLRG